MLTWKFVDNGPLEEQAIDKSLVLLENLSLYFFGAFIELHMIKILKQTHFEVILGASGPFSQISNEIV